MMWMSLCDCTSSQNRPDPKSSALHIPASGVFTVTIRPQFSSVISMLAELSVIAPPEGCVTTNLLPLVFVENTNVTLCVLESTGILTASVFPLNKPVPQKTVETLLRVDSRTN
jgi:hypothetical protein